MLTPQQVDEWNGTSAPAADPEPEMLVEAPTAAADLNEMSKRELEDLGREHGIELDRRESKSKLVAKMKKLVE
jgi:hypothetical protein